MSIKRIVTLALVLVLTALMPFLYPSTDNSINAEQSKLTPSVPAFTTMHRIAVVSNDVLIHYFGKDVVEKTMKQPGCVSVRMYYGKQANGRSGFVIVGVDKKGRDIVPIVLAGPGNICPPFCG